MINKIMFAIVQEISLDKAAEKLRAHLAAEPPAKKSKFRRGDIVMLDTKDVGIVSEVDSEGSVSVYYINDEGLIQGPSFGWTLTKLNV